MNRYDLVTWPESQQFIGDPDAILVFPDESKEDEIGCFLDSAYMVPSPDGEYVRLEFPESQGREDDPGALESYDGDVFVPAAAYAAA